MMCISLGHGLRTANNDYEKVLIHFVLMVLGHVCKMVTRCVRFLHGCISLRGLVGCGGLRFCGGRWGQSFERRRLMIWAMRVVLGWLACDKGHRM